MSAKWAVRNGNNEWIVGIHEGHVILTQCRGYFGVPATSVAIDGAVAGSVAKCIAQAGKLTKPKKANAANSPGQRT